MIAVSIVIPTYRRPELLQRTVDSCLAQQGVTVPFEIVVIDNDAAGSAETAVRAITAATPIPVRYVREDKPGISHARNTGVAEATGRYLVFIDDDEEAEPQWLAGFVATIENTGADAVMGPVLPRFPPGAVVEPYYRKVYTRDAGVPTGTILPRWSGIGNTILNKESCFGGQVEPFDPRLGLTGGEDSLFFRQLLRRGGKLAWCAEAVAWETIPADKLTTQYLLRRAFRGAQTTTFVHTAVHPPEWGHALFWMAVGCAQVLIYTPVALLFRVLRHERWLFLAEKALGGLGKVLWHPKLQLRLYR